MDRRQKKTRQAIYDAFTSLLEEKNYLNITVQDIIDRADIGRSTFYLHFETKDELMKAFCKDIFDHVFSNRPVKEKSHDFSSNQDDLKAELTHILYHLRESKSYLKKLLLSESGEIFNTYFKSCLQTVFEGRLNFQSKDIPADYLVNHLICDFAESVRWWMRHDIYTPEEMTRFFFYANPVLSTIR